MAAAAAAVAAVAGIRASGVTTTCNNAAFRCMSRRALIGWLILVDKCAGSIVAEIRKKPLLFMFLSR